MFKYPLAVTIDTNIFDAAKFDLCDTSPLKTLENYVKNGKIKVVLSDIVVRESKRHIADQVKKICGIMRKARAAALEESTEHLIRTIGLGEILRIVTNKDELISKGEEMVTIPKTKNAGRSSHHRLPRPASSFTLRRKASL